MYPDFTSCVLYTTATCNLKCRYCYIDKSPILVKIDHILEESFKGDYYFNFMKDIFKKTSLTRIEFWGGEPSYGLKRAIPTVQKAIEYFPNLSEFMMSTNLTTPQVVDDLVNFLTVLTKYPQRKFRFSLQLSLDGPTYINDYNRGAGVTEKFTDNFSKLLFAMNNFLSQYPQITVDAFFKGTWDNHTIELLQTEEAIIDYFRFYESYKDTSNQFVSAPNWDFHLSIPNTATPSQHTQADGIRFKNLCHLLNVINKKNQKEKIFKYYEDIMIFRDSHGCAKCEQQNLTHGCALCGTGKIVVGLLPNRMLSCCHGGFTDLLSEYKKIGNENQHENSDLEDGFFTYNTISDYALIYTEEDYKNKFIPQIECFDFQNSVFSTTQLASLIKTVALAGQIDEKYKNPMYAISAAHFIFNRTSGCIRDNLAVSGSKFLFQLGFIRLFLNGAKEEIEQDDE